MKIRVYKLGHLSYSSKSSTVACMLSLLSCPALCDPMDVACQAPLLVGFSRKDTGVGCHVLLQGIFPTQGSNQRLLWLLH